jgi:DNA topoisomerase I
VKVRISPSATEPREAAKRAGLRYVSSQAPGIRRVAAKKGFVYIAGNGKRVRAAVTVRRIERLAIPPAWTDVWICRNPLGHLQACGRDARGRKQNRYHARWTVVRDATKFDRMLAFGRILPRLRARVRRDLARPGLSREKVLAAIVALLDKTLIRVGNDEYARQNGSIGLTTMKCRHVKVSGAELQFRFRGKSGVHRDVGLHSPRLARIVKSCQDLPGQELFQYLDERGRPHKITSGLVNDYLRAVSGQDFTAKDFRTWTATVLAAQALQECGAFDSPAAGKRKVVQAIDAVAERLGNTRSICQKCYVHPALIAHYLEGNLLPRLRIAKTATGHVNRHAAERAVLAFLRRHPLPSGVGTTQ